MTTTVDTPATWDRVIRRGTDHSWGLRRVDSVSGNPVIPNGAHAQVRSSARGELFLDLVVGTSGPHIEIDGTGGYVYLIIPKEATEGAEWDCRKTGVWDLEVDVSGVRYRWVQGRISVSQDVTHE